MKLRRTMKAQSPKKKEKERNNKEKRRGFRSEDMRKDLGQDQRPCSKDLGQAQRICSKKNQHQGLMYVQISNKKVI